MNNHYDFKFHGEDASFDYGVDDSVHADDRNIAVIKCDHPIFGDTFGKSSIRRPNFRAMIEEGKRINPLFFDEMESAFLNKL